MYFSDCLQTGCLIKALKSEVTIFLFDSSSFNNIFGSIPFYARDQPVGGEWCFCCWVSGINTSYFTPRGGRTRDSKQSVISAAFLPFPLGFADSISLQFWWDISIDFCFSGRLKRVVLMGRQSFNCPESVRCSMGAGSREGHESCFYSLWFSE